MPYYLEAIRKLDATVSILQAKVNITQKGILGSMIILIEEESSKAEEVIEYLKQARNYRGGVRACLIYF